VIGQAGKKDGLDKTTVAALTETKNSLPLQSTGTRLEFAAAFFVAESPAMVIVRMSN
jgi:hypothetical protein